MDRSRIGGAISGVEFVRDAGACTGADVVWPRSRFFRDPAAALGVE